MTEYTPSAAEVRTGYGYRYRPEDRRDAEREFDRWLAAHDREVSERALVRFATETDASPAVTWSGKGGVKERLIAGIMGERK